MEKRQNERNVHKSIRIAVAIIILAGLFCFFLQSMRDLLANDSRDASEASLTINIHEYPDKLVYVMGKDTELDLTGGKVCFGEFGEKTNGLSCMYVDGGNNCGKIYNMADVSWYTTDVNFSEPGIYFVCFAQENIGTCAFAVEVIDPEQLK